MYGIKSVVAAVTVATMVGSSAFAADGAFTSGKPAGVRPAQAMNIGNGTLYIGLAAAAVVTAVAITVSNQSGNNSPAGALGTGNANGVTPGTTS
ncbi:MAG TPA: hypothetical protein VNY75_11075 [Rhizomicrobium sp.]|nr:hypothetical protein [Rhizomicrobium sp.]